MNSTSDNPFETPPAGFMQTGNQIFESGPAPVEDTPFGGASPAPTVDPFGSGNAPDFAPPTAPQTQNKYAIVDLFWMINQKLYNKQQLAQNEAAFTIISFNLSFGNMRVAYFNLTENSIQKNIVYLENLKRTVSGTIYPATAFNAHVSPRLSTTCLEQLFKQIPGANWQQERPVCTIEKNEELIRFTVKDPKFGTYFYDFATWQREAFLYACKFAYTKGFELTAQQHLK